jgi:uncharacterized membrane protein YvlD (DUF360 family)
VVNLIASGLVVLAGLYLALVADVGETSDMQTFGWVLVAAGVLGVIASIVLSRLGQGRDRP